jgi:RNA polymerase sigma-70 factor (ECF subfamily)
LIPPAAFVATPGLSCSPKQAKRVVCVKARSLRAEEIEDAQRPTGTFATTHWSIITQAAETGTAGGRAALEELCRIYWHPLYWFARRRGLPPADAEDLTQSFLADLLARGALAKADPARGRFRTFLLASFKNFHSYQRAHAEAAKRGGGCEFVSLQEVESRFQDDPVTADSPEKIFDREWALSLIEQAVAVVRQEYATVGNGLLFQALKAVLWREDGAASYAAIAHQLGSTEGAIRVAVHRLRRRLRETLRAEVAKTVMNLAEIDDETRHLLAAACL